MAISRNLANIADNIDATPSTGGLTRSGLCSIYNVTAGTIQQVSLVSYGDITTNTLSAQTLSAGSYINVWGRQND